MNFRIAPRLSLASVLLLTVRANAATIFVDPTSPTDGPGTQSDWSNAYHKLANALSVVASGDEVLVANGTFRPDETTANPNGTGTRATSFVIPTGVVIQGGCSGYGGYAD